MNWETNQDPWNLHGGMSPLWLRSAKVRHGLVPSPCSQRSGLPLESKGLVICTRFRGLVSEWLLR